MHSLIRTQLCAAVCAAASAVMLGSYAAPASAAPVSEAEPNNSIAAAQNLDAHFTLEEDANIADSTTVPHATVNGTGDNPFDYYSFTVPQAGVATVGLFDIDGGMPSFDSWLRLYDSNGALLASVDDAFPADPGSVHPFDSRLQLNFASPGTYYVEVGEFPGPGAVPSGGSYQLHVSVPNHLSGVAYLLEQLDALVRSYNLPLATQDPLIAKVTGARNSLALGRLADTCNRLADFDRRVNELSVRNRLTAEQATELLAAAAPISGMLGCP